MDQNQHLFNRLLEKQQQRGYSDHVTKEHALVWLHTDLGPSYYLGKDARVYFEDPTMDVELRTATEREACVAIVLGARNLNEPLLLDLLPARPDKAQTCEQCQGTRWWPLPGQLKNDFKIICPACSGKGWRDPSENPLSNSQ